MKPDKANLKRLALACMVFASPLAAQDLSGAPMISESEWRKMTAGQTVVYQVDKLDFAYEHYLNDNRVVVVLAATNVCEYGTWFMRDDAFCFAWETLSLMCFHHKVLDDDIYIIGLENGMETNDIQRVSRIIERPLQCAPDLLSALDTDTTDLNERIGAL